MPRAAKPHDAFEAKLHSSGLTLADAKQLGITSLTAPQTQALHPKFRLLRSLRLDYFDHLGKPAHDWPGSKPFYRLRYLGAATDFDAMVEAKAQRYVQEPDTAPVAYLPKNQDWCPLLNNLTLPIVFTEGELKAAKACKEGFPTIGLGGVSNWRSHKLGLTWLPQLESFKWVRRSVYICFDSDLSDNPSVAAALWVFAEELHRRGAYAYLVSLPKLKGLDKVGLDDFLVHGGPKAVEMLKVLLHNAVPLGLTAPLWGLNEKYTYVQSPGLIVEQHSLEKISVSTFHEGTEVELQYQEQVLKPDGNMSYKAVSASKAWMRWPQKSKATSLTYEPGAPRLTPANNFNLWTGWGVVPKKGSPKPFLELIDYLFTGAEAAAKTWFLRWCAYPIQHPGTKLFTAAVFHGNTHGTGKSFVGFTLGEIYGKNFTEINKMHLHSPFNEWAEGKQLVMGDDLTGSDKRDDADFLKKLITQKELRVNRKFLPSYTVPDCVNYFFTANHADSFYLEDTDRRFFVHEVQVDPKPDKFYKAYDKWLYEEGGGSIVFHYLLNLDLAEFNPSAAAFRTQAKERMTVNVQSDLGAWVRQLKATPNQVLRVGEIVLTKDLFTSKELLELYDPSGRTKTTANGLGRELARAGIRQVADGMPLRLKDGYQARYYAVKNAKHWLNGTTNNEMTSHLDTWLKQTMTQKEPKY